MTTYRLKKDLRNVSRGSLFYANDEGDLVCTDGPIKAEIAHDVFDTFPGLLDEYFEEIPEQPKTVWDLEDGDECWQVIITPFGATTDRVFWHQTLEEKRSLGLVTLTKEECLRKIAREKARVILERDTKGFKPDWKNTQQPKYYVYYDEGLDVSSSFYDNYGVIYFATREDAEESIKNHPNEWKTYLGVEE